MKTTKKLLSLTAALFMALQLSGCASTQYQSDVSGEPLKNLDSASVEASKALQELADTHDAIAQSQITKEQREQDLIQATAIPDGFEKPGSLKYSGDATKAAKMLADLAGYSFKTL